MAQSRKMCQAGVRPKPVFAGGLARGPRGARNGPPLGAAKSAGGAEVRFVVTEVNFPKYMLINNCSLALRWSICGLLPWSILIHWANEIYHDISIDFYRYLHMSYGPGKVAIGYGWLRLRCFCWLWGSSSQLHPDTLGITWQLSWTLNGDPHAKIIETGVLCYVGSASRCSLPGAWPANLNNPIAMFDSGLNCTSMRLQPSRLDETTITGHIRTPFLFDQCTMVKIVYIYYYILQTTHHEHTMVSLKLPY